MKNWLKVALAATVVLTIGGTASASTSTPSNPTTQHATAQPANAHPLTRNLVTAVDSAVESRYTPIAPCRIVDTRIAGGAIAAGHARAFHALGSGNFGGQGGTSCNIPTSATAVTGSVIATHATGTGYLKVFGYGAAEPTASFLNYAPSPTLSASGTIPVARSSYDFTVKANDHPTQVVIQLTGYYIAPMWVEATSTGSYLRGSRVVSLSHLSTGTYQVDFDRDISGCAYTATSFFYGTILEVQPRSGDAHGVFVAASDYNGVGVDTYFYLTVTC